MRGDRNRKHLNELGAGALYLCRIWKMLLHAIKTGLGPPYLTSLILLLVLYSRFLFQFGYRYLDISNVDFPSFYTASVAVFDLKTSPYSPDTLRSLLTQRVHPYLYPPPTLLLFYPLSLLTYEHARIGLLVLNHLLIVLVIAVVPMALLGLSPRRNSMELAVSVVYLLVFDPLVVTLNHGQVNVLLLVSILAFWLLARRNIPMWAGMFLALATLLKTYPVLILAPLLVCRRYREVAATMVWLIFACLVSVALLPPVVWRDWLFQVLPTGGYGRVPVGLFSPAAVWNQSLNGFLSRLFTENKWSDPLCANATLGKILAYAAAALLIAATLIAALAVRRRSSRDHLDRLMLMTLPLIYLVSPFSWEHHLVYLLPTILALLTSRCKGNLLQTLGYHAAVVSSASLVALRGLLRFKFFAVLLLWGLAVISVLRREIELPNQVVGTQ